MPFTLIMPDNSLITIESEDDKAKVEEWFKNNPDSKEKPSIQFPVDIVIKTKEGDTTIIVTEYKNIYCYNEEKMKAARLKCKSGNRDYKRDKDKCRKLLGDDVVVCIKAYVSENHPKEEIAHARRLKTKSGNVFYVVKLSDSSILKFNDSCELLD